MQHWPRLIFLSKNVGISFWLRNSLFSFVVVKNLNCFTPTCFKHFSQQAQGTKNRLCLSLSLSLSLSLIRLHPHQLANTHLLGLFFSKLLLVNLDLWNSKCLKKQARLTQQFCRDCTNNEAESDVNTMLDGSTYPRWKISWAATRKLYFELWKTQQANIRDQ